MQDSMSFTGTAWWWFCAGWTGAPAGPTRSPMAAALPPVLLAPHRTLRSAASSRKRPTPSPSRELSMHDDAGPRDLRILVVDDNHDLALTLSTLLELEGHRTSTAHNGLDAVEAATAARYDAVVLDLGMPLMDGFEAAAVLGRLQPAPLLIACSA